MPGICPFTASPTQQPNGKNSAITDFAGNIKTRNVVEYPARFNWL